MTSKKVVLKLHIHDNKEKQKALKAVASISGLESVAMDMKEKKLTVVGEVDPVEIVGKLRRLWRTDILTVGPAKEPEKKNEPEPKKPDDAVAKKKAEDDKRKEIEQMMKMYPNYNFAPYYPPPPPPPPHYRVYSAEENPNSCVIC